MIICPQCQADMQAPNCIVRKKYMSPVHPDEDTFYCAQCQAYFTRYGKSVYATQHHAINAATMERVGNPKDKPLLSLQDLRSIEPIE
jgi:hypothetical protein